jgi:hypothetical protein
MIVIKVAKYHTAKFNFLFLSLSCLHYKKQNKSLTLSSLVKNSNLLNDENLFVRVTSTKPPLTIAKKYSFRQITIKLSNSTIFFKPFIK